MKEPPKTIIPYSRLNFETLKRGDIITNTGSGRTYVVHASLGDRAIAVDVIDVMNASEWEVYNPPQQ